VAWLGYIFTLMTLLLSSLVALILYAKYSQCDPFRAKIIKKPDQIYPFFVIQTFGRYPGFTGLFIGSILSASLSTVSSGINSITTVILEDIYKRISIFPSISGEKEALISKILYLLGILVFGSNDPKSIDKSLLCTWKDAFGCDKKLIDEGEKYKY
ncbi:unnamed protein product, partial [Rotaria sordida]